MQLYNMISQSHNQSIVNVANAQLYTGISIVTPSTLGEYRHTEISLACNCNDPLIVSIAINNSIGKWDTITEQANDGDNR